MRKIFQIKRIKQTARARIKIIAGEETNEGNLHKRKINSNHKDQNENNSRRYFTLKMFAQGCKTDVHFQNSKSALS